MNEAYTSTYEEFDQNILSAQARNVADLVLEISEVTIEFADVQRVPRYCPERRESNVEHSFMLGLTALEVGTRYYPGLDSGLMTKFALVHDLPELKTGDVPTFKATEADLVAKQKAEQAALAELCTSLPSHIADMLMYYEEQQIPEAILVRHLDKLLPYAVDINGRDGAGIRTMAEDYQTTTKEQLMENNKKLESRFSHMFPAASHDPLHKAHQLLARQFARQFS